MALSNLRPLIVLEAFLSSDGGTVRPVTMNNNYTSNPVPKPLLRVCGSEPFHLKRHQAETGGGYVLPNCLQTNAPIATGNNFMQDYSFGLALGSCGEGIAVRGIALTIGAHFGG